MTDAEKAVADAAAGRRQRDLERAVDALRRQQDARIHGVVSFHLQAGRIVRAEILIQDKFT